MKRPILSLLFAFALIAQAFANPGISQLEVRYLPIGALLTWNADEEMDITGFNVERSLDGFSFEIISRVIAEKGPAENYNYLDTERPDAKMYYRITAFDRTGGSVHSPLAEASRPQQQQWNLTGQFAVDVKDRFDFEIESQLITTLACELHDFLGNPLARYEYLVQPGPNQLSIPMGDREPGAFRLYVQGEELSETINFIKVPQAGPESPLVRGK